jgi:hypothetical protein
VKHRRFALVGTFSIACGGSTPSEPPPPSPSASEILVDELETARRESAHMMAQSIRQAAMMYVVSKAACPASVDALVDAQMLPGPRPDPWGKPFVVTCKDDGATIAITSPGKDGQVGTADDITVDRDEE